MSGVSGWRAPRAKPRKIDTHGSSTWRTCSRPIAKRGPQVDGWPSFCKIETNMRPRLQHVGACLLALAVTVSPLAAQATKGIQGSPKIIDLFLDWQLKESDVQALSKWDVVVFDADQQA